MAGQQLGHGAARGAIQARKNRGGRPTKDVPNPFSALIRDARKELSGVLRDVVAGAVKQQLTLPEDR